MSSREKEKVTEGSRVVELDRTWKTKTYCIEISGWERHIPLGLSCFTRRMRQVYFHVSVILNKVTRSVNARLSFFFWKDAHICGGVSFY
jgi:hypothetical protein